MSTPAEALAKFWEELRSKARVEIEHPDLPEELKATAAEAIATLWRQASSAARAELEAVRIDARAGVEQAQRELQEAQAATQAEGTRNEELAGSLRAANEAVQAMRTEIEAERRAHTGTAARLQEVQAQLVQAREQLQRLQDGFSAELGRAQRAVQAADERAAGAQRKALLEVEQERSARGKSEKTLEAVRTQLADSESRQRDAAVKHAEEVAGLSGRLGAAQEAEKRLQATVTAQEDVIRDLRKDVATQREQAVQASAQAQTARDLLAQLVPAQGIPAGASPRSKKTKATGAST